MIEKDTIRLLRECDAGVKMGVASIDDVIPYVDDTPLKNRLLECKSDHEVLSRDIEEALERFGDEGKEPNPFAKRMSWVKTNMKLMLNESDKNVAALMTDGCNMGVKSLNQYLNEYEAADEDAKRIAKRLIRLEEQLAVDIREYL